MRQMARYQSSANAEEMALFKRKNHLADYVKTLSFDDYDDQAERQKVSLGTGRRCRLLNFQF
jgi:hypothetical protein